MTEAVIASELGRDQKNEAVQMLDLIASEAARPKEQRRLAIVRPVIKAFAEVAKVGASLAALWDRLGPTVTAAF
jgi:hypothetical protein